MTEYKINCDIARDLMPLVIDDVASDATKAAVEAHTRDCEACRSVMAEMRRDDDTRDSGLIPLEKDTHFIQFCKKMERQFTRRRMRMILIVLLLALAFAGFSLFANYMMYEKGVPMTFKEGEVSLFTDKDGFVFAEFDAPRVRQPYCDTIFDLEEYMDGSGVAVTWIPLQTAWPQLLSFNTDDPHVTSYHDQLKMDNGQLYWYEWEEESVQNEDGGWDTLLVPKARPVKAMYFGTNRLPVYKSGDTIPYSPSMEHTPHISMPLENYQNAWTVYNG